MGAIDNVKELAGLIHKIGDLDLYRKILDLQNEVMDLSEENRNLKFDLRGLAEQLKFAGDMSFAEPFWYMSGDPVPHCPSCWESKKTPVHLHYKDHQLGGGYRYDCHVCKTTFRSKRTPAPPPLPLP